MPPGGVAADLRGLSVELLISVAGVATSGATVALDLVLQRGLDLELLSLTLVALLPAGAILGGMAGASGYYVAARATDSLPSRRMLLEMLAIALSTWFLAQWLAYALLRFPNGAAVRDVLPFWDYFRLKTEHMRLAFENQNGTPIGRTRELGRWGYVQELLQVLGFLAGGLMMFLALRRIEACEPCGRYARTRPLLRRVSTIRLDDLLRRAGLVLPNLADAVRAAVGARRLIALNLRMAECPGCRRHWLRPEAIVAGVAAGCRENGCALLGGETAEMPGVYTPPDYDLAGFVVGWVEEGAVLGPERVREGDVLIGLASSGLHTNGYSLARRIVAERLRLAADDPFPGETDSTAAVLLRTHRSYLAALAPVLGMIHAMAHVTGGGLPGNVNRALPATLDAEIDTRSWTVPNVFAQLERAGGVARAEMFHAFNMGVGLVVLAAPADVETIAGAAESVGVGAWRLGRVVRGAGRVRLV